MSIVMNIADMPIVKKILAEAKEKIREVADVEVELVILESDTTTTVSLEQRLKSSVQVLICKEFGVYWSEVVGKSRLGAQVSARHAYLYIMNKYYGKTCTELAREMHRDHTSVLFGIKKVKWYYETNDPYIKQLKKVIDALPKSNY